MKKTAVAALAMFAMLTLMAHAQVLSELSLPPNGDNQRSEVSQWIGPVRVSIDYHSPNVHGGGGEDRTGHIYGDVVHYGFFDDGFGPSHATPWRVGANESTTITFSHDVQVEGHPLKAGTYALFLAVEKEGPWTWVFSTNPGWGAYQYDPKEDALRISAAPQESPYTEFLSFNFDERRPESAVVSMQWEKKRVSFKVQVPNVNEIYVAEMRKELRGWPGFNWQNWSSAAMFCAANKINLDEALVWADKAIREPFRGAVQGHRSYSTLRVKAAVLHAMQRDGEADAVMQEAIHLPGTEVSEIHSYGMSLLAAKRNQLAMEVFQFNRKQHPEEQFFTSIGLARGYTALGDNANAIKNWELALQHVPEERKALVPTIEKALQTLKNRS